LSTPRKFLAMQMIDKFNEKLKQIVDEEQVTWYQLSCAPPDSHENIIAFPRSNAPCWNAVQTRQRHE